MISFAMSGSIFASVIRALICSPADCSCSATCTSVSSRISIILSKSFVSFTKYSYAWAVTTKPGGTGMPACVISPRFAPFPPATPKSFLESSSNHAIIFTKLFFAPWSGISWGS